MKKMNKKEYFAEVLRLIDESISLTDVLKLKGYHVIDERKRNSKCLCPFHGDRSYGSFVISNQKKIYKCFSCGEGGGSVHKLIYQLEKNEKTFSQAMMDVALYFGLVKEADYQWFFKRKSSEENFKEIRNHYLNRQSETWHRDEIEKANLLVRHQIYTILTEGNRLQNPEKKIVDYKLTPEHHNFLYNEKKLTVEQIKNGDFFSMPNRFSWKWFVKRLIEEKIVPYVEDWKEADLSILKGVPGFMQYRDTEKWTFNTVQGIGIALRDSKQYISAVQVRHDKVTVGSNRYRFYSSSFADEFNKNYMNGVGAGSPVAVLYPKEIKSPTIFITEGYIKANVLTHTFDCISLSVQGVNSWRGIIDEVNGILEQGYLVQNFFICYDADMAYNIEVFKQAISMTNKLKELFPKIRIMFVSWDVEFGKGIDDMIHAGYQEKLSKVPKEVFDQLFLNYEMKIKQDYQIQTMNDWRRLDKEVLKCYFHQEVLSNFPQYDYLKQP